MTIIEAIKSGKPFRRKGEERWVNGTDSNGGGSFATCYEDILADDWEIKCGPIVLNEVIWKEGSSDDLKLIAYPTCSDPDRAIVTTFLRLIGKKTRVTVEVIE
jgi:hypothetical protein